MSGLEPLVIQRSLGHIGRGLALSHGIDFHHYRIFGMIAGLVLCIVHVIHAAVTFFWHLLRVAKVVAAPDILASAGALVAVSVEVVIVAAFIAFLEAIAILAAVVTASVSMLAEILGATAWTVFINLARLTALVTDPIAVVSLATLVAMLKDDALKAARITVNEALYVALMAAFSALTNFSAKTLIQSMILILVVIGATFSSIPFIDKDHLLR
jgi:hypothetical protein